MKCKLDSTARAKLCPIFKPYDEDGYPISECPRYCIYKIKGDKASRLKQFNVFCSIMCEHVPVNAKDSGAPEWSRGELIKAFNDLVKNGVIKEDVQ